MDASTNERLLWYIFSSSRNRLENSMKTVKCLGLFHIILEILENGFFSSTSSKILTISYYSMLALQVWFVKSGHMNPLHSSFIIGETLNLNLVYYSYFLTILSQISGFVMIYYQGYLSRSFTTSFLLSLKQVILWAGTGIYLNKLKPNEITPLIISSLWLLIISSQATYFEYLKESDIIIAKQKVKNANAKITSVMETLQDFIIVVSKDQRYLFKNSSADKFLGNNSLFEMFSLFNYCNPFGTSEDRTEKITKDLSQSFSLNIGTAINFGLIQKDQVFIELEGKMIIWDEEPVLMLVGRDVSKLINLEKQNLENSYKTILINTVSHELRTPINAILSLGTLVLQSDELSRKNEERVKIMMGSCSFQLCLVNDLLDYAQSLAGCFKVCLVKFDFYGLLDECFGYLESQLGDMITLIKNFEGVPEFIVTDPNRLKQILLNLLSNARKFTTQGFIRLKVRYENPKLIFSCSDSGIGISSEKFSVLFKEFSKLEDSQGLNHQGVGLGLVISNILVKALGGEGIKVESQIGVGSTFSFYIKVTEESNKKEDADTELTDIKNPLKLTKSLDSKIKILLVDDNYFNILAYVEIFKSEGISCNYSMNGEQAIDMIKKENYSCILMDCEMPILDGWETTKLLYKLKENNEIKHLPPIIGATAYSDNESIKKCLLVGMNDVVPKPCPKDDLFRKVRHWILKDKDQI